MLKDVEQAIHLLTNLNWISPLKGWLAGTFSTDIKEYWSGFIVPILIHNPKSLGKISLIEQIEVIQDLSEVVLSKA